MSLEKMSLRAAPTAENRLLREPVQNSPIQSISPNSNTLTNRTATRSPPRRAEIEPSYESQSAPGMIEILKLLPKTNCGECGEPTCMVFAIRVTEGVKGPEDCPPLDPENATKLTQCLSHFDFEI